MSGLFLARYFGPQTKFQIQVEETVCSAHLSLNPKRLSELMLFFRNQFLVFLLSISIRHHFEKKMSRNTTVPTKTPNEVPPCCGVEKLLVAATVTTFAGAVLIA